LFAASSGVPCGEGLGFVLFCSPRFFFFLMLSVCLFLIAFVYGFTFVFLGYGRPLGGSFLRWVLLWFFVLWMFILVGSGFVWYLLLFFSSYSVVIFWCGAGLWGSLFSLFCLGGFVLGVFSCGCLLLFFLAFFLGVWSCIYFSWGGCGGGRGFGIARSFACVLGLGWFPPRPPPPPPPPVLVVGVVLGRPHHRPPSPPITRFLFLR